MCQPGPKRSCTEVKCAPFAECAAVQLQAWRRLWLRLLAPGAEGATAEESGETDVPGTQDVSTPRRSNAPGPI
jgi:hypothetical protein